MRIDGFGLSVLVFSAVGALAQAVPPPAGQVTANCRAPVYATDFLVCSDPELRALDAEMAQIWVQAVVHNRVNAAAERAQDDWFRRRSLCAFKANYRDCTFAAYEARMVLVRQLAN